MLRTARTAPSGAVTCTGDGMRGMQAQHETPLTALREFLAHRSFAGLESAVLLCLVLIAVLAESGLLGGALALLP